MLNAERKAIEIYLTVRELQALYEMPLTGKKFGHKSMSRNPLVFGLFTRMHVVEKVGSRVPRMRELMKDAGLSEPIFSTMGFFTVTFMKRVKPQSVNGDRLNDRLNSREKRVIQILEETPGLRTNELSSMIEVSIPTLSRTLKNLIDLGLIEYRGAKKTGGYFVL